MSRPRPGGEVVGLAKERVSRSRPVGVCIPACNEADPPPSRRVLLRTVRILLECILFFSFFIFKKFNINANISHFCVFVESRKWTDLEFQPWSLLHEETPVLQSIRHWIPEVGRSSQELHRKLFLRSMSEDALFYPTVRIFRKYVKVTGTKPSRLMVHTYCTVTGPALVQEWNGRYGIMWKCSHWSETGTGIRIFCFLLCQSYFLYGTLLCIWSWFCTIQFIMYCTTQGVYKNEASVHICMCRVLETCANENITPVPFPCSVNSRELHWLRADRWGASYLWFHTSGIPS